jgi:hypothetical protein
LDKSVKKENQNQGIEKASLDCGCTSSEIGGHLALQDFTIARMVKAEILYAGPETAAPELPYRLIKIPQFQIRAFLL